MAIGKKLKAAYEKIEANKQYGLNEALSLVKNNAFAKFDETFEVTMRLGVDPRHSDQMVRGMIALPNGTGKNIIVAVFAKGAKAEEARKAGADIVGDEELVEEVKNGRLDFGRVIATPDMMAKIGQVARILGPRGLMPNPKLGTVTQDVAKAVKEAKAGQVEYKTEKAGIVQAGIGKISFTEKQLLENIKAFISAVVQAKPAGAKGNYIKGIYFSSTMGAGVDLDVTNLLSELAA